MFKQCVYCDKEAEGDVIINQWCSKWEHRVCAGISLNEYNIGVRPLYYLINLSIILFSNSYNFAYYSDTFYLLFSKYLTSM